MLSLEVGDPGDSLSTLLICHVRLAECQSESVLAGGNSDGGLQVATGRRRCSSIGWGAAGGDHGLGASFLPEMDQNCSVHRFLAIRLVFRFRLLFGQLFALFYIFGLLHISLNS